MAEQTGISWTRSSRNAWAGCTKVGPGCDRCYAEESSRFFQGKNPATGEAKNWGPGAPRVQYLDGFERDLRKWNKKAGREREQGIRWDGHPNGPAGFWPVFVNSFSDTFDNEVPQEWRERMFAAIDAAPNLTFLLVTKRIGNVAKMLPGWYDQSRGGIVRQNVWIGVTVVNQEEADRDIPKLLETPAAKRFVSYEPALGPIHWKREWLKCPGGAEYGHGFNRTDVHAGGCCERHRRIDWIIVGGENHPQARVFDIAWALWTIKQCRAAGCAPFVKQLGSNIRTLNTDCFDGDCADRRTWPEGTDDKVQVEEANYQGDPVRVRLKDRAGANPEEWPQSLRIQEFPA